MHNIFLQYPFLNKIILIVHIPLIKIQSRLTILLISIQNNQISPTISIVIPIECIHIFYVIFA